MALQAPSCHPERAACRKSKGFSWRFLDSEVQTYYFRSKVCKDNFTKDPQEYLAQ